MDLPRRTENINRVTYELMVENQRQQRIEYVKQYNADNPNKPINEDPDAENKAIFGNDFLKKLSKIEVIHGNNFEYFD
jgi:hypothetical protein